MIQAELQHMHIYSKDLVCKLAWQVFSYKFSSGKDVEETSALHRSSSKILYLQKYK